MKALEAFLASVVAVFAPIEMTLLTVLILVSVDLVTGLLLARKNKEPISSLGIKKTVVKLLVYEIVICLSYLIDQYLTFNSILVLNMVSSIIGITELKSVAENINILTGGGVLDGILKAISAASPSANKPPTPPTEPPPAA